MRFMYLVVGAILLALACGAQAQVVGPANAILCGRTATSSTGAATTRLVTAVAGQRVYICGWDVGAGAAAGGFQFVHGTGSSCTSSTAFTAAYTLAINTYAAARNDFAMMQSAVGADVCVITTGTGPTAVTLYFSQF